MDGSKVGYLSRRLVQSLAVDASLTMDGGAWQHNTRRSPSSENCGKVPYSLNVTRILEDESGR